MQWLCGSVIAMLHPFYISMTDINHNAKNKTLEISVRIFADDFENALRKRCNCKVELMKPADKAAMEKLVANYISSHLSLKVDDQPATMHFAGYNAEDGSIWSFFEVRNINAVKKLSLFNVLLYDYTEQQANMLHIKANGKERTEKLDHPKNTITINW